MSRDVSGWGQVIVGVISVIMGLGVGWVALTNTQAETRVKLQQLETVTEDNSKYNVYLQEQVDGNKERIIITETTIKYLSEDFKELNSSLKTLVTEVQELNQTMAVYTAKEKKE